MELVAGDVGMSGVRALGKGGGWIDGGGVLCQWLRI